METVQRQSKYAPDRAIDDIYRALGKGEDFRRLSKQGLTPGDIRRLTARLSEANKEYSTLLTKDITISDVERAFPNPDGDIAYILNTAKWKNIGKQIQTGGDFKHILAKHVDSSAPNTGPIAGSISGGTKFRDDLSPEQVEEIIQFAAKNGKRTDPTDSAKIVYSGDQLLKFGIEEMRVIEYDKGVVWTAYPTKTTYPS